MEISANLVKDGYKLIDMGGDGVPDELPDIREVAQGTVSSSFSHCCPLGS